MKSITLMFFVAGSLLSAGLAAADNANLPNFATVHPGLMRGAAPTDVGLQKLKVAKEKAQATSLGMTFVNIPMGANPPTPKQVANWLSIANAASPQTPVFVHCQHGADRTGEMVGIYREVHDGWPFAQTYLEMRHYGFKKSYAMLAANVKKYAKS